MEGIGEFEVYTIPNSGNFGLLRFKNLQQKDAIRLYRKVFFYYFYCNKSDSQIIIYILIWLILSGKI
jgi:hypothetical protein